MKFSRFGRWMLGAAAATSMSVAVTHCSSPWDSSWTPTKPTNVPDNYSKWDYNWDKREHYTLMKRPKPHSKDPSSNAPDRDENMSNLKKKKATAIRHLILIRHGQYDKKDEERRLTCLGKEQAELTGKRLRNSGMHFDSIVCSNMPRAIESAEIILKQLDRPDLCLEPHDPILMEGPPCLPEPPVSRWKPELYYYEDGARIEAAFRKYFHRADPNQEKDSYEIIVFHANVIRYFTCRALQFPGEAWRRISLNNCSLTVISILPSGRVVLRALGDSGHLPADKTSK